MSESVPLVQVRDDDTIDEDELVRLYRAVDWVAYTREDGEPDYDTGSSLVDNGDGSRTITSRAILAGDDEERRVWVVSHLLRYGEWDDIWEFVSRDEVRELFPRLYLPDNLRAAWARMLKIEAPVA